MSVGILELKNGVLVNKAYATKGIKTVTDKGFFGFEIISGHLWLVYGAIKPDISFDENQHLIIDFDGNVDLEEVPPQTAGYPLGNVENLSLKEGSDSLTLTWSDPDNIVFNGEDKAVWAGTKVVRKEGAYPTSETDGTVIADSTVKDQYAESGLVDTDVMEDMEYKYVLFPYTDKNIYTMSDLNRASGSLLAYKEVLAENSWYNIHMASITGVAQDFWSLGDEKDGYKIIGFNHDDLADGSGKAGITFDVISSERTAESIYSANYSSYISYSNSTLKNTLETTIWGLLPEDLKEYIKIVKKAIPLSYNTSYRYNVQNFDFKLFPFALAELFEPNAIISSGSSISIGGSQKFILEGTKYEGINKWFYLDGVKKNGHTRTYLCSSLSNKQILAYDTSGNDIFKTYTSYSYPVRYGFCI